MRLGYTPEEVIQKIEGMHDNLKFVGWGGEFTNSRKTQAVVYCKIHNLEFTSLVSRLFWETGSCPLCTGEKKSKAFRRPDNDFINEFIANGEYAEGTTFTRSNKRNAKGHRPYWDVHCPVCAKDEFGQAGLCSGIFTTDYGRLMRGEGFCRCHGQVRLSNEQWTYRIAEEAKRRDVGISVVGEVGAQQSGRWIAMHCEDHGPFTITARSFWYRKRGCPACVETGFLKHKPAWLYILNIAGGENGFTGYGISNQPDMRIKTHIGNLARSGYAILNVKIVPVQGQHAYYLETAIRSKFGQYGQDVCGFKKEATYPEHFLDVVQFVKDEVTRLSEPVVVHPSALR